MRPTVELLPPVALEDEKQALRDDAAGLSPTLDWSPSEAAVIAEFDHLLELSKIRGHVLVRVPQRLAAALMAYSKDAERREEGWAHRLLIEVKPDPREKSLVVLTAVIASFRLDEPEARRFRWAGWRALLAAGLATLVAGAVVVAGTRSRPRTTALRRRLEEMLPRHG